MPYSVANSESGAAAEQQTDTGNFMTEHSFNSRHRAPSSRTMGITQAIFVAALLFIILAGGWSLYMQHAPYHPEAQGLFHD